MLFKKIKIENFRNFSDISVDLADKNIIFGMNDVGKSNFIHALRLVFDQKVRNSEVLDTDFYNKEVSNQIRIEISLSIEDSSNEDVQKLKSIVKSARSIEGSKDFYINLMIKSEAESHYVKYLTWGDDYENLVPIPTKGINFTYLDSLFYVTYIPSYIETNKYFTELKKDVVSAVVKDANDLILESKIKSFYEDANLLIEDLSSVKKISDVLNGNLKLFDNTYTAKITSMAAVDDLYSQLRIYTQDDKTNLVFPASGDGRQKKLMYAMLHYLLGIESERKIPILLLEEPENHLFISAQVDLSESLFSQPNIGYVFATTHSNQLFYRINVKTNLIRIYKSNVRNKTICSSASVTEDYFAVKKVYQENLSNCYFVNCVVLVEGPSEKLLCDAVLSKVLPLHQLQKVYVLSIVGYDFAPYKRMLEGLGIGVIIRTDNDIYKNDIPGLKRCLKLVGLSLSSVPNEFKGNKQEGEDVLNGKKDAINKYYRFLIVFLRLYYGIYLAEIDLENDLERALRGSGVIEVNFKNSKISLIELKEELQDKKWHNMYDFIVANEDLLHKIYESKKFSFLKRVKKYVK